MDDIIKDIVKKFNDLITAKSYIRELLKEIEKKLNEEFKNQKCQINAKISNKSGYILDIGNSEFTFYPVEVLEGLESLDKKSIDIKIKELFLQKIKP